MIKNIVCINGIYRGHKTALKPISTFSSYILVIVINQWKDALFSVKYIKVNNCEFFNLWYNILTLVLYFWNLDTWRHYRLQVQLLNFDWLIDYLRFYVTLKNFSLIWRHHHCQWWAAKFRPMLGVRGLWAGRDLYRATPAVTQDLGFSGLIQRTAPFSRHLRHTRGYGGSILIRILTGKKRCTVFLYSIDLYSYMRCEGFPLG
jgi:hypothetical protein